MTTREIFLSWERLRVLYNAVLLLVLVAFVVLGFFVFHSERPEDSIGDIAISIIFCAVIANVLYMAGPVVESYLNWLSLNTKSWRVALFSVGLVISVVLELGALAVMASPF